MIVTLHIRVSLPLSFTLHHSTDSVLDAVAIILIPENESDEGTRFFASCMAMEPTPPAPPIIRIDDGSLLKLMFPVVRYHFL